VQRQEEGAYTIQVARASFFNDQTLPSTNDRARGCGANELFSSPPHFLSLLLGNIIFFSFYLVFYTIWSLYFLLLVIYYLLSIIFL